MAGSSHLEQVHRKEQASASLVLTLWVGVSALITLGAGVGDWGHCAQAPGCAHGQLPRESRLSQDRQCSPIFSLGFATTLPGSIRNAANS